MHTTILVIGKEGVWVCYRKGKAEMALWTEKRGGLAEKEGKIIKDGFFVGETKVVLAPVILWADLDF